MKHLDTFKRFNRKVSTGIEWVGLVALVLMMLITTVDVIGAKVFLNPVFGSIDIMMLAQLVAMACGAASTLIIGRHIQVEFFVPLLPKRVQAFMDCIVRFLGFVLFVLIAWQLFVYGHDLQTWKEVSPTVRIPLHPFAYAAAFACVPVCLIYVSLIVESVLKVLKR
jgi:TRAP-type C4-dicarboxylate transport system permease small subunit